MANEKSQKSPKEYTCIFCEYNTSNKKDYNKHLQTDKHSRLTDTNNFIPKSENNYCECGKKYIYVSSLCKHKKKCNYITKDVDPIIEEEIITQECTSIDINTQNYPNITPELLIEIIKQNKELQQALIDQNKELQQRLIEQNNKIINLSKKSRSNNTINNNCGNTNKTFNLQLFLNETCKDAINMSDFINQIQISLSELEDTGNLGYAEGISKVFIKNLNNIDYTDRPIHCSDLKRETLYIKDNNQWLKDDANKSGLTKAIKLVANKNIKQISEWQKLHPQYSDPESKQNDKYMQIVLNSMSGSTKEESDKNYEKIAKNVIKEVVIDK
jgi:hypothetical protein